MGEEVNPESNAAINDKLGEQSSVKNANPSDDLTDKSNQKKVDGKFIFREKRFEVRPALLE